MAKMRMLLAYSAVISVLATPLLAQTETTEDAAPKADPITLDPIVLSAEEQIKQALGVSIITAEDLKKTPVVNDVAEIIRRMPGVNYTATSTNGRRGNQRQIDIRGMGSENTLILIDGKPVQSRYSVRLNRGGDRDTRGDSNWVPAEMVERIEVLRGPAAARYGSGAAGGVVNIITKRPETFTVETGLHYSSPDDSDEGDTKRANVMIAGPIGERLTFRLYGNYNKTDGDDTEVNAESADDDSNWAGMEGVVNKDVGALLSWDVAEGHELDFEMGFSRQGNIYAGDFLLDQQSRYPEDFEAIAALAGQETNRQYRRTYSVTHRGEYDFGESTSYLQYETTSNTRMVEGSTGSVEGLITADDISYGTIDLENVAAKTEWIVPLTLFGKAQKLTIGAEFRGEWMDDRYSTLIASSITTLDGSTNPLGIADDAADRPSKTNQQTYAIYLEDNIQWSDRLTITPTLRFDYNTNYGLNVSPGVNAFYKLNDEWEVKVGVARAFKTPGLFQLNPNYLYFTRGNGCPSGYNDGGGCYIMGNEDLDPETSINKEIGIAYTGFNGINASLTVFHNDYKDRIQADWNSYVGNFGNITSASSGTAHVFQWYNVPDAVVSGVEGSFSTPLGENFSFTTNGTYMIEAEDETNDTALSLIPEYTLNAMLEWYPDERSTVVLGVTHYGETEAATDDEIPRPSYSLWNLSLRYQATDILSVAAGVNNIFDKQLKRTNEGANTYNVSGRAFFVSLNSTF